MKRTDGPFFTQSTWAAKGVQSLCWSGEDLIDWVAGGAVHLLDGTRRGPKVHHAYRFDSAVVGPDGHHVVIYEKLGTKAVLLRDGSVVRELNRSFYHATAYEYPVCLFAAPNGRLLLAHCPDEYNRIEIEDAATGERLTGNQARQSADFFHSRLQANPSGSRLLSAGWVWHPWEAVVYFDVAEALRVPATLDQLHAAPVALAEEGSACWLTDDRVILGGTTEEEDPEEVVEHPGPRLRPRGLAVYDLHARQYLSSVVLPQPPGTMMPMGSRHVVAFYEHPRVIAIETGEIVYEWPEIDSGLQAGSIIQGLKKPPPSMALDPSRHRFAIADADAITVVQVDPAILDAH